MPHRSRLDLLTPTIHLRAVAGAAAQDGHDGHDHGGEAAQVPCPSTATAYTGAVASTSCGGCDAFGLIELEECADLVVGDSLVTCGDGIIAGTTLSAACKECVDDAYTGDLTATKIVRELGAPWTRPSRRRPRD